MKNRAVIYARTSSEGQKDKETIVAQLEGLPVWTEQQGWSIVEIIRDDGRTGTSIAARPGFQRVLELAETGAFDILVVRDWDRLTRSEDPAEWGLILSILRKNGIKIASPREGMLDVRESSDELIALIKSWGAADERRKQLARQYQGKIRRLKENRYIGQGLPFGYRWNKPERRFEVVPEEITIYQEMVRLCLEEDLDLEEIAAELNARGYTTRKGARWSDSSVWALLRNSTYRGSLKVRTKQDGVLTLQVPAVINEERFLAIQERLRQRRAWSVRNEKNRYLCAKLLRCGLCGSKLIGQTIRGRKPEHARHAYYVCYNRWQHRKTGKKCELPWLKVRVIDEQVWQAIAELIQKPEVLEDALRLGRVNGWTEKTLQEELAHLDCQLQENQEEEQRLLRLYRKGKLLEEELDQQRGEVKTDRLLLEQHKTMLEAQAKQQALEREQLRQANERLAALRERIESLTFEERQAILRVLVHGDRTHYIEVTPAAPPLIKGVLDFQRLPKLAKCLPAKDNLAYKLSPVDQSLLG